MFCALGIEYSPRTRGQLTSPLFFSFPNFRVQPVVGSAVMTLLLSIKALLECFQKWSERQTTDSDVSDAYVRLAKDFDVAVAEFAVYGIETESVPFRSMPPSPHPNATETLSRPVENSALFPTVCEISWRSA